MLVRVVALLSLGVLCSSAPLQRSTPTSAEAHPSQQKSSRPSAGLIIREVLQDMEGLNLSAVPSLEIVHATVEKCMQSYLKTFAATLTGINGPSKYIAGKLFKLNTYKNLPKDLDRECKTVQVTSDVFLKSLDGFLRLLFEKIQNA